MDQYQVQPLIFFLFFTHPLGDSRGGCWPQAEVGKDVPVGTHTHTEPISLLCSPLFHAHIQPSPCSAVQSSPYKQLFLHALGQVHNALSDTLSSLDSACRFAAEPFEGFSCSFAPQILIHPLVCSFWDQELSRTGIMSTCPAQPGIN